MRKTGKPFFILVVLVLLFLTAVPVLAYFTANVSSNGGWTVHTGYKTKLIEDIVDEERLFKSVHVENGADSCDVYVRVRAFCPADYGIVYGEERGEGEPTWMVGEDDGWMYFVDPVGEGGSTSNLKISVVESDGDRVSSGADGRDFNVIVVYEAMPVTYGGDGKPMACDWTQKALVPYVEQEVAS